MILDSKSVQELIPQKNPFVMVGELLIAEDNKLETNFIISQDNIMVENGEFSTPGLIENIAQTCATGFGYIAKKNGEKPKIGFIGSISKLKAHQKPKVGQKINTIIEVVTTFANITLIKGMNYLDGEVLVECEMKIVIT